MTIYLYGRVSSTDQAADMKTSLQLQRDACWRIASYHDWKDAVWIEDAGVSGSVPIDERPAGSVLIKALQPADTLIVAKLDRAFRSALDALQIAEQFRKASISLIIADIGTDPVTGNGSAKMFFGMLALVAEFERERIRERVAEGRNAKRAKGGHIGGPPPYGFIVEGSGTQARLVPDPKFADLYDTVRSLRNDNYTLREISEALSRQGYVNRRGRLFDPTQIKRFLSPTPNRSLAV